MPSVSRVTQPSLLAWEALGHRVLLGLADAFKGCDECPSPARAPSPPRHLLPPHHPAQGHSELGPSPQTSVAGPGRGGRNVRFAERNRFLPESTEMSTVVGSRPWDSFSPRIGRCAFSTAVKETSDNIDHCNHWQCVISGTKYIRMCATITSPGPQTL